MNKFLALIALLLGSPLYLLAQSATLTGRLLDQEQQPLASATVMLLRAQDSVLQQFALTNPEGYFEIKKVSPESYLLQASFLGFNNLYQSVEVTQGQNEIALGALPLTPRTELLEEVIVKEERIPIALRKDTIEFDANAYSTQPNAAVEDLLKKLPGVEVGRDGTVRAQGEEVKQVLVEGKEFFGRDPKMATKNLPADAVDKVQVFDKKSDMAEFSGIDDGQRDKTINLKLKEDKKKGYFGKLEAGYGPEPEMLDGHGRYRAKGNLNRFTPQQQLSFIGLANNVSEPGFSFEDYINFMGGIQGMMGGRGGSLRIEINPEEMGLPLNLDGNSGIAGAAAGGINFNQDFSDKTDLSSSLLYNRFHNDLQRSLRRESFLEGNAFTTEEDSRQNTLNNNQRANLRLDHEIDSTQSVRLRASGSYNTTELETTAQSRNFQDGLLASSSDRRYNAYGHMSNWDASALYRKRLGRPGRVFTSQASMGMRDSYQSGQLDAYNTYYPKDGNASADTLLQDQIRSDENRTYGLQLSYSEPLNKRNYLEWRYSFQRNQTDYSQEVYDKGDGLPVFNENLSNAFNSAYTYHQFHSGLRANGKKTGFNAGLALQRTQLDGELLNLDTTIAQTFWNLLPAMRWEYEFNQSQRLTLNYRTSVREPSIRQLQPIVDNSDPFNIYIGNPALRPEYTHGLEFQYFNFNAALLSNFFNTLSLDYSTNAISQAFSVDEQLVRTTTPINTDRAWRLRNSLNYGTPIRPLKARINLQAEASLSQGLNRIDGLDNQTDQRYGAIDVSLENRFKEKFDLLGGARLSYTQTHYSIQEGLNQDILNQTYYGSLQLNLPAGLTFNTNLDFNIYSGRSAGYNQEVLLWNAYLSKTLLDNRAELRFSAFDILNRNRGISRRTELNYVEDERVNNLARYFLLSFTYSLQKLGQEGGMRIKING
ncbi:MAG: TonB-dependent receptor family protein [Phaeodactylibacter sp.]|nr:TonB-dependent receptor family protein [Phaeodactylibacter sp.]MCB9301448.1 outer membrane beta-barrel protein [Lewinellaceae bacterium]